MKDMNSAAQLAQFRAATEKNLVLNHAQRYCESCKKRRSVGQFRINQHPQFCDVCVSRGAGNGGK